MTDPVADYVVVGGGSAGAAVAGRLSESGRHSVVLLEAGPSDLDFWILIPVGYGHSYRNPRVNWMYQSEPEPGLDDRRVYVPRGKVLGGSSSINAMVWSRGQAADFDEWEALGNPGWGWRHVLPVYRRLEDHALGAGPFHGAGGPVGVSLTDDEVHPLSRTFVDAAAEVGVPRSADLNGETIEGAGLYQISARGGVRMSASRAYLWPARGRANLRVVTRALATRIVFEGQRAIGVAYRRGGVETEVRAGREVVVCAGAINTPQLLQLSGVGPAEVLRAAGIAVRHHHPAVGRHMQDHICHDLVFRARVPTLNNVFTPLHGRVLAALRWFATRRGPLSISVNQAGGYARSRPDARWPDMQLYFCPLTYEKVPTGPVRRITRTDPFPGFSLSISPCRPTSRGSVTIRSADPAEPPAILANLLGTPEDVETAVAGVRLLRRIAAAPSLAKVVAEELKPGPAVSGDEEIAADLRARAYSVFHPVGSCRMGPEASSSVVDARLAVHGLSGLRIVDASVFPAVTSGNTNAPAIMVGERGADFILEDARG